MNQLIFERQNLPGNRHSPRRIENAGVLLVESYRTIIAIVV